MTVKINEVLKKQNRSIYWLAKQTGITYQNMLKLCNNETTSINFIRLQKICTVLNCTPNDIFDIDK